MDYLIRQNGTKISAVKITDRLVIQQIAKNHLVVHRKEQLANLENMDDQIVYIDYLNCPKWSHQL
ncbi:MAG: hypothetical protein DRQ49_01160 [Gammaproteobacteria bacterium]|nr:MAG: hypothetical protein DRQ41_10075 [Gammaproteobacteria bacterium]RKZ42696.1 MAG: hypothetical protein DRQ49_01160 [Gammaproteobacteria bacterium]RKZ74198.1 MAG: hypothetical protein DRQ57_11850 [Gammaproteobacteria bacterium]